MKRISPPPFTLTIITLILVASSVEASQIGAGNDKQSPSLSRRCATVASAPTLASPSADQILQKSRDAYAALSCYSDSGTNVATIGGETVTTTSTIKLQRPNLYRIEWFDSENVSGVNKSVGKGAAWCDGLSDFWVFGPDSPRQSVKAEKMPDMPSTMAAATPSAGGWMISTLPEMFFNQPCPGGLLSLTKSSWNRMEDEKVNGIACYVVCRSNPPADQKVAIASATFWIGKKDHFIHQAKFAIGKMNVAPLPAITDEQIKKVLEMQGRPATPEDIAAVRPVVEETMKRMPALMNTGCNYTETRGNIAVNKKIPPPEFAR